MQGIKLKPVVIFCQQHLQKQLLSILFDMNQLWEEYVLHKLRNYVDDHNLSYEITGQESKDFWGSNSLRPDIVITDTETKQVYIIDTKWKLPGSGSASVQDLRQMYAYGRFWDAEKVMLMYPR
jgi:5-methylcytosine-specific restriction enzyme subunit McrC